MSVIFVTLFLNFFKGVTKPLGMQASIFSACFKSG